MTVQELIEKLKQLPADLPVCIHYLDGEDDAQYNEVNIVAQRNGEFDNEHCEITTGQHIILTD